MKLSTQDRERIARADFLFMASASADGTPYALPLAFAVDWPWVVCASAASPDRSADQTLLTNIEHNPSVSLLVSGQEQWHGPRWIRMDGQAQPHPAFDGNPSYRWSLRAAHPDYYADEQSINTTLILVHTEIEDASIFLSDISPATKRVLGERARTVLSWAQQRTSPEFSQRECLRALRSEFPRTAELVPVFEVLEATGYIRRLPDPPRQGPGRSPSPRYTVAGRDNAQSDSVN